MELRAWPVFKPYHSTLIASPPYAGILDGIMDELGYKSLGKLRMMKSATLDLMKAFDEWERGRQKSVI